MLIKPPFKHFKGAKHCAFCGKYIHPSDPQYTKKIYCDEICRDIAETIRKLGRLLEIKGIKDKKIQLDNIFLKDEESKEYITFSKKIILG